ncbi:hypothetical protein ACJX0J_006542, partial [Zea mays]
MGQIQPIGGTMPQIRYWIALHIELVFLHKHIEEGELIEEDHNNIIYKSKATRESDEKHILEVMEKMCSAYVAQNILLHFYRYSILHSLRAAKCFSSSFYYYAAIMICCLP